MNKTENSEMIEMRCAAHPNTETGLTCNKCGKPICPKCMVQTPVGARCPDCAKLGKLPTFVIAPTDYMKALPVGLLVAIIGGIIWFLIRLFVPFLVFFNFIIAAAIGYAIGELMGIVINRKRGLLLKILAAFFVLIAFIIGNQITPAGNLILSFNFFNMIAIGIGIYLAVSRL
jgi:hypothetical protein